MGGRKSLVANSLVYSCSIQNVMGLTKFRDVVFKISSTHMYNYLIRINKGSWGKLQELTVPTSLKFNFLKKSTNFKNVCFNFNGK